MKSHSLKGGEIMKDKNEGMIEEEILQHGGNMQPTQPTGGHNS
jgi:hypothetical protein